MKRFFPIYILFLFTLWGKIYGQDVSAKITKPDSNFKSIHQYQSEVYAESLKVDTGFKDTNRAIQNDSTGKQTQEQSKVGANIIIPAGIILLAGVLLFVFFIYKPGKTS